MTTNYRCRNEHGQVYVAEVTVTCKKNQLTVNQKVHDIYYILFVHVCNARSNFRNNQYIKFHDVDIYNALKRCRGISLGKTMACINIGWKIIEQKKMRMLCFVLYTCNSVLSDSLYKLQTKSYSS